MQGSKGSFMKWFGTPQFVKNEESVDTESIYKWSMNLMC